MISTSLARRLMEKGVRFVQLYHQGLPGEITHVGDSFPGPMASIQRWLTP